MVFRTDNLGLLAQTLSDHVVQRYAVLVGNRLLRSFNACGLCFNACGLCVPLVLRKAPDIHRCILQDRHRFCALICGHQIVLVTLVFNSNICLLEHQHRVAFALKGLTFGIAQVSAGTQPILGYICDVFVVAHSMVDVLVVVQHSIFRQRFSLRRILQLYQRCLRLFLCAESLYLILAVHDVPASRNLLPLVGFLYGTDYFVVRGSGLQQGFLPLPFIGILPFIGGIGIGLVGFFIYDLLGYG